MSKITWDDAGSRFYETGVNRGVLYRQNSDGTYGTGVAWNGLTGVTESPDGAEATDLWADNIKYASMRSAENFGGTIEAYTFPEEFAQCDGSYSVIPGVYLGQQTRVPFGLSYRTEVGSDTVPTGEDAYKLHIVYGATASPSQKSYETINDSPNAITLSWEFKTTPINVTGHKPLSLITIDTTKLTSAADQAKLASLEDMLYGTANSDPTLPSPETVIALFDGSASAVKLSALSITGATLSPTFDADTVVYTTSVTGSSSTITATAETGATAAITVNGTAVTSGSSASWNTGSNLVVITVTKSGSLSTTYTIGVTKSA